MPVQTKLGKIVYKNYLQNYLQKINIKYIDIFKYIYDFGICVLKMETEVEKNGTDTDTEKRWTFHFIT